MLTPTLCACGCLQPVFVGDWLDVRGRLRNHSPGKREPRTLSYLILDTGYRTPCWVWQGPLNKWGYGKIKRRGVTGGAHRLFYGAYVKALPKSKAGRDGLDHLCRIRRCVNPDHLEPITCVENIRRGNVTKLSPEQVSIIRLRASAGEDQKTIAAEFGIRQSQVSRIKCGVRWSDASIKAN